MFAIPGPAQFVAKHLRTIELIHFFEFSTRDFFCRSKVRVTVTLPVERQFEGNFSSPLFDHLVDFEIETVLSISKFTLADFQNIF